MASENENLTQSIRPKSEILGTGLSDPDCIPIPFWFHGILVYLASRPLIGVAWGIRPPVSYNREWAFSVYASSATSSPHRRTLRARVFRAGGLLGMIALLLRLSSILHVIFL